jgi:hypothetical protein
MTHMIYRFHALLKWIFLCSLNGHIAPPQPQHMLIVESRITSLFWKWTHNPISFKYMYFWCQFLKSTPILRSRLKCRCPNYRCVQYRHIYLCLKWSLQTNIILPNCKFVAHPSTTMKVVHPSIRPSIHLIRPPIYSSMLVIRLPTAHGRWMLAFTPDATHTHTLSQIPFIDGGSFRPQIKKKIHLITFSLHCSLLFLFWVVFGVAKWLIRKVEHTKLFCILMPLFGVSLRRSS